MCAKKNEMHLLDYLDIFTNSIYFIALLFKGTKTR